MKNRTPTIARWIAGATLGLASSFQALGAEEHLGHSQDPLVSDVIVTDQQQERLGLLQMSANGKGCSASLLTNQWVLTAAHCLDGTDMRTPGTVQLRANWGANAQLSTADYIYRSWALEDAGPLYDVALVHLRAPIRVNGSTSNYMMQMTDLTSDQMKGLNVAVYGRGINALAFRNSAGVDMPTTGDNQFRSYVFPVDTTERKYFWFSKGPNSQTVAGGDSGGPTFETSKFVPRVAGVHAWCNFNCLPGKPCGGAGNWTWVSDIKRCADTPIGNLRDALAGVMGQVWDPARPIQTVQVSDSERQVLDDMALGNLGGRSWDYARRAAQMYCRNRGYEFGFLDGNYQDNVRYQARCVSAVTGYWYDAGPADMGRINDRFATIYNVNWAQAARAANDICAKRDTFNVGGLFTGWEAKTAPAGGFADQRTGVWCFNKSNATWFDSTSGELAAQGTPMGDLNATNWSVAGRAATEYCRRKHYPAGGFFNGHQVGDKRGVVCLGMNSLVSTGVKAADATTYSATRAAADPRTSATSGLPRGALVTQAATAGKPSAIASVLAAQQPAAPPAAAPAVTTFYAINLDGSLTEYRHGNPESGTTANQLPPSSSAWNTYDQVIPAGGNHLYARAPNGDLLWFQHDGVNDGANAWRGPVKVGSGWQSFKQLIGGGNGVIYALAPDGTLMWYRHAGFANGDPKAWVGPKKVGTGWNSFKAVFSAGEGVIYAVTQDDRLMVYRHLDPMNGEMRWSGPVQVGNGWGGFAQLFSAGNGVIYGLATDGKLAYYRHLTWNAAQPSFKWVGALPAGQGFNPAARLVPLLP